MPDIEIAPLAEAPDFEAFKDARRKLKEAGAESAPEKTPQAEEVRAESAAEPAAAEPRTQESQQEPIESSDEDRLKELRKTGKHAAANKLEREIGAKEAEKRADAKMAELRKELDALRQRPPAPKEAPQEITAPAAVADPKDPEPNATDPKYPRPEDFFEFLSDRTFWKLRQQQRTEAEAKAKQTFTDRAKRAQEEGRKSKPDFDAVIEKVPALAPQIFESAIVHMDNFHDVLYALGSDPTRAASVAKLPPLDQWAELRSIARELSSPPAQPATPEKLKPAVSRVAPAPRVLSGTSSPPPRSTAESKDFEDYKVIRHRKAS